MIWVAVDFVFVQNAEKKLLTIVEFLARKKNALNVEQNYSGKIPIITSCLKKRKLKRIQMTHSLQQLM